MLLSDEEGYAHGYFFKTDLCYELQFLVQIEVIDEGSHAVARVYELEQHDFETENGGTIKTPCYTLELIVSIDLWGKYYFPTWNNNNNQCYYNIDGHSDYLGAYAWVAQKAIELGLKIGKIELY